MGEIEGRRCRGVRTGRRGLRGLPNDLARVLVFPEAFIGGVTEDAVSGPSSKLDLGHQFGLHPANAASRVPRQRCRERGGGPLQPFEVGPEVARERCGEAGPDAPYMDETLVLVDAENERTDRLRRNTRGHIARDDEFLALRAFGFLPMHAATGEIGPVAMFRDDPFQAQPTGMPDHGFAVALEMRAVAQDPACRRILQQRRQKCFPLDERQFRQIVSIEIEKVECIEDHPVRPTRFQVGLQGREAREPGLVFDDEFAIEESRAELQVPEGGGNRLEFRRPVEAFAGEELDVLAVDPRLQTIAVELDLVDPLVPMGSLIDQGCETRLDEGSQQPFARLRHASQFGNGPRLRACSLRALRVIRPDFIRCGQIAVRSA